MKKKTSGLTVVMFAFVLPCLLAVAMFVLQNNILDGIFWFGFFPAAVIMFAAYIVGCIVLNAVIKNKGLQTNQTRSKIIEQKDKLINNQKKFRAKNTALAVFIRLYIWLIAVTLIVLHAAFLWLLIALIEIGLSIFLLLELLIFFLIFSFLYRLFLKVDESINFPHMYLSRREYPKIWDTAFAAKTEIGVKGDFMILAVHGFTIGITMLKKTQVLLIGTEALRLLNQAELYSVFLHEFGHAFNKDNRLSRKRQRLQNRLELLSTKYKIFPAFLFSPLLYLAAKSFSIFTFLTSYAAEQKADKSINKPDDVKNFINAIAKTDLYNIWYNQLPKKPFGSSENIPDNYFEEKFNEFVCEYQVNKQHWENMCLTQLEARIDTHPNLPQRMKSFGVESFVADFSKDDKLSDELQKIRDSLLPMMTESWNKTYKSTYLKHKSIVALGESAGESKLAHAYYSLCDYQNALKYYDTILSKSPNNSIAVFRKGLILCDNYDNAGIEYLFKSLLDSNLCDSAFIRLAMYLQLMGLEEKRQQIREEMYYRIDQNIDIKASYSFKIRPAALPQDIVDKIKESLKARQCFSNIYLANRRIKKQNYSTMFLCLAPEADQDLAMQELTEINITIADLGVDVTMLAYQHILHMGKLSKKLKKYRLI